MRRLVIAIAVGSLMVSATAAFGGPSEETFKENDAWICEDDGFVENHCLNANSMGTTLNIKVFDPRGPQESASTDPAADSRPCPHDAGGSGPFGTDPSGGDGTWWNFLHDDNPGDGNDPAGPLYVCHHSGQQQFLP